MGREARIEGVHVVPMGKANAFPIEGQDGLTLINVCDVIRGLDHRSEELNRLIFTHGHPEDFWRCEP